MIGIIGIILLIGIVKKNGIMLVDFAITREREGFTPEAAVRAACLLRFRPIMMTTMATLFGGLPLMLFTTPVVYLYLDRFQVWLSGEKREHEEAPAALPLAAE